MHRRGIYNSSNLFNPSRLMLTVLRMCQDRGESKGVEKGVTAVVGGWKVGGVVSLKSEVNPARRSITCTNECARCLCLTLPAPALVFMGLEGFLLSGGSDRLSKVHCVTHTSTRAECVCVCVYMSGERTLAFSLAVAHRLLVQQRLLVNRLLFNIIRSDIKRKKLPFKNQAFYFCGCGVPPFSYDLRTSKSQRRGTDI